MKKLIVLLSFFILISFNSKAEVIDIFNKYELIEELVKPNQLTIIVFHMHCSGPSKRQLIINNAIDQIVSKENKVCFANCEADMVDDLAQEYCVTYYPTMIFYKGGNLIYRHSGVIEAGLLMNLIIEALLLK